MGGVREWKGELLALADWADKLLGPLRLGVPLGVPKGVLPAEKTTRDCDESVVVLTALLVLLVMGKIQSFSSLKLGENENVGTLGKF